MTGEAAIHAGGAGRFARLAALLAHDPDNLPLLADAAEAGFAEERFEEAAELLARHERIAPLPAPAQHLAGLAAMRLLDWQGAARRFDALLAGGADAPPVRFNLAWSLAMDKRFDAALAALDEAAGAALPQAAQLEVRLLHELGDFARAGDRARALIALHPDHRGLNAAVSTLAIDIEDETLAQRCAERAGDHPDALATLGTLALGRDEIAAAAPLFEAALARDPDAPRAWIGKGLVALLAGDPAQAAQAIDRGAGRFDTHLGSWIAAGWAHAIAGDTAAARERFERACALDDAFAEAQGSLAVVDLLDGRIDEAKRRTAVALRLDRQCFSGALAAMLLAAGAGDGDKAKRIFETALDTPTGDGGRTIAQSLARLASR
ncbi:MAG: tetratricopeptide repeat protein [Sphingomonas sp.]